MNCEKLEIFLGYFKINDDFRTHGFDSSGSQYDADGNFVDWWQNKTKQLYKDRFKCMISEYNNFTDTPSDLNANGTQTLNENIADNGKEKYNLTVN